MENCTSGAQFENETPEAAKSKLAEAQATFDQDAKVSVDRNKITYVCELCACINLIDEPNCTKCGKPRPRAEFVNALRSLRDGVDAKAELEAKAAEEARLAEEAAAAEAEKQSDVQFYRYEGPAAAAQQQSVHQPFIIVPYVDTHQKLYQYQPSQAYRFVPYTQEELDEQAAQQAEMDAAEYFEMKAASQQASNAQADAKEAKCCGFKKSLVARAVGAKNAVVGIATIALMFFFAVFSANADSKGLEIFKSFGNCFSAAGISLGFSSSAVAYVDWTSWIAPICYALIAIISLVVVIAGLKKLITGKGCGKGWLLNFSAVVVAIAMGAILYFCQEGFELSSFGIGYFITLGLTALSTLIALFTPSSK